MGSAAAAAFVAHAAFWTLFAIGMAARELSSRAAAVFLGLWTAALLSGAYRPDWLPFASCVAVLDIALVFAVFKGDVKLS
jgi:hypothetical protein